MTTEECPSLPGGRPPGGPVPRRRLGAELELELALDDDLIVEVGGGDGGVSDGDGEEEEEEEEDEVEDEVGSVGSDLSSLVVPFPELAPVVFFCLKQTTCPRSWCIRMPVSTWFERISIMVILLNCVTLGMYQPCENIHCTSDRCQILQAFDAFIYVFFALEMVVKMVALGIFGQRCYLGDTWNRLDFFIVMSGMVEYSLDLQNINLSAIRTVRVLRPLKAINRVPSMRILVNLLLDTLPMLGNVLLLCFFVFFIFGIIGVQLWAGLLRNRLALPMGGGGGGGGGGGHCDDETLSTRQSLGLEPEGLGPTAAAPGLGASASTGTSTTPRCHTGSGNPHKGAINFDNIVSAWIVIFQVITLEGWVEIMYYVMDAHSFYNFIYFIFLIIIGSFFMINLCLVVIATQFSETKQREHQLMQEQRAACLSSSTLASLAEPGDCYEELFQLVCHVLRKARRRSSALYYTLRGQPPPPTGAPSPCPHQPRPTPDQGSPPPLPHSPVPLSVSPQPEDCPLCALSLKEGAGAAGDSANGEEEEEEEPVEGTEKEQNQTCLGRLKDLWDEMRRKLWGIVESKYFSRGIMMAILINTISMGIEHHNQPDELTNVLEICNIVFTSMFTLEMVLKLTAFGFFDYLRNPYNIFDGIIVIISVCEIIGQADGGLSVLRTFRLLRVIKLVRFMPALRRQLVVLMKTMDNVATFCMLLMLFIFIFSILGMHIFGCKFSLKTEAGDTVPDRKNFDSLLWAIVTVFQILTQEDWNMVLYNGMASTSPCAALYFVALMTFGNYVLFNLLVAILVEGFQAEGDANRSYSDDDRSSCNFEENDKKDLLRLSDPKICTLTPNGHLDLPLVPALYPRETLFPGETLYPGETLAWLGARKTSVISLGRSDLEQRGLVRGAGPLGRGGALWARRSSWNTYSPSTPTSPTSSPAPSSTEPRPLYGHAQGRGSLRVRGPRAASSPHHYHHHWGPRDEESLLLQFGPPPSSPRPLHLPPLLLPGHFVPRRDRRALSLDLCFRVQKMLEVYRPDWCETREEWSVFLFSPENKFRQLCQAIIAHKLFDYIVLAFIFSNCITVALERPKILQGSLERVFLTISNYIFTAIFVSEMTLKVVSMGFYLGEQTYLRSSWNVLDGFLVFVSLIDIVVSMAGGAKILGVLRVLRLLRTLRPLRVISRAPGLKLVVETLITSLKPIGNIVLICCAFFIIFGILEYRCGVCLFKGKFFYCFGLDVRNITNRSDCLQANYKWVHHKPSCPCSVLASKDGWVNIMYHGLDAVGLTTRWTNNNPWMLLYFISFLLIVSFFVLNMFVGVVVENFHKCRQHQEVEEAKRREEKRQRRMEKKRRNAQKLPYYSSYSRVRLMVHTLCTNHWLDSSSPSSSVSTSSPCLWSTTASPCKTRPLLSLNLHVEAGQDSEPDWWNQLDLAIVLLSVMGITLEEIEISSALPINPTIIRIMRVLRIARALKCQNVYMCCWILQIYLFLCVRVHVCMCVCVSVGNLGLLFMLLFFIYAALGVELFGELVCNEDYPCEGMSRHATFENFGMAFLTLFQVSTGDNWNGIMKVRPHLSCIMALSSLRCTSSSFVLTAQFVLINVVVAVLMKHLDDSNKEAKEEAEMDAEIELELLFSLLPPPPSPSPPPSPIPPPSHPPSPPPSLSGRQLLFGPLILMVLRGDMPSLHFYLGHSSACIESQWLDSVSLLIKDSLEGEMQMIDNLSGSVFHHYSSPCVHSDLQTGCWSDRCLRAYRLFLIKSLQPVSDRSTRKAGFVSVIQPGPLGLGSRGPGLGDQP
uniref:Ion transport domain-containing protein n=1 Tax=Gadus morhua TaxID=8049 RepID=A0A8C5FAS4_GADMO